MHDQIFELQYAMDTFYFLICGALVMWMAAGFAMLEAGLVRTKNTTEILTKNVALFAIACTMYLVCGYNFMYDGGLFLSGVTTVAGMDDAAIQAVLDASNESGFGDMGEYAGASDFFFQVVFVATAMSIVSGAVAERMKLWAFLLFAVVMTGFIYPIEGGWTWGGKSVFGLYDLSYSDYAGSGIVHLAGAAAALAGVLLLGPRNGKYQESGAVKAIPGANLPLATLGTFILWMGWFGFNGGSTLKLGGILFGKTDLTMCLNGALAGLVAITAEPADPTPLLSTIIGAIGGAIVVFSIVTLDKLKIDDPVGAISVHGTVGVFGIFAVLLSDPDATFMGQLVGMLTIFGWVFGTSFVAWMVIKTLMGIRVSAEEEEEGLDIIDCGMEAYPEFVNH
jgi:Amt family ammonium transporter